MTGLDATGTSGAAVPGLLTAAGVRGDGERGGLSEVETVAATVVTSLVLPGAVRVRPPAVRASSPATSTALPATGLPSLAQRTCPRATASAPTASANSPNAIVAPLKP